MTKNVVVFDIDGCLVSNEHRLHLIKDKKWAEYFAAWEGDKPIAQGIVICRAFLRSKHYRVIFITSRSERSRETTLIQLQRFVDKKIKSTQLFMRPNGVYDSARVAPSNAKGIVPDTELKLQLLKSAGYTPEDVFFLYEDKTATVETWRAQGVVVLQPAVQTDQ